LQSASARQQRDHGNGSVVSNLTTVVLGHTNLCPRALPRARATSQLMSDLDDLRRARCPYWMAATQQSATGVDAYPAAQISVATANQRPGVTGST